MTDRTRAGRPPGPIATGRAVVAAAREREVTFLGAAVAYYAFVSLVPMALLTFAVASAVGGEALTDVVRNVAGRLLTPSGEEVLFGALDGETGRGGATLTGVVVLTWSSLRLFRGLDRAFSAVYGTDEESFLEQLRDAAIVLGAVGLALAGMAAAGAGIRLLPVVPGVRSVGALALWLTLLVAFLPLYYFLPDAEVTLPEALPGAALAGGTFTVLGTLFGYYTTVAGSYALYGVLGAVLLLVTWLYVGATAVLVGAVLNAVLADRVPAGGTTSG